MRLSAPENGENTIVLSGPHVPPRWVRTSYKVAGVAAVSTSSRFSLRSAKNPIDALSGDQNGEMPPSVPGSCLASSIASDRIQSAVPSSVRALKTTRRPSGEMARMVLGTPSSTAGGHLTPAGRLMDAGTGGAGAAAGDRGVTAGGGEDGGGVSADVTETAGGRLNARFAINVATTAPATNARATIKWPRRDVAALVVVSAATFGTVSKGLASRSSMSRRASAMSASRRPRSFSRHRLSNVRSAGGVLSGKAFHSGSPRMTAPNVSATATPGNARLAVSISYNRQPNAQMSLRPSTLSPMACSGLT